MASSDAAARSQSAIMRLLKQADGNVLRLAKILSVTSNLETFYLTVSYTLHLLHATLSRYNTARLAAAASTLADRLTKSAPDTLLPGETLVATIEQAPSSRALRTQQSTAAFLKVIDDFRMFMRLKSLINMWAWGSGTLRSPNPDPVLQRIALAQVVSCTGFAALENVAYLATKGVITVEAGKITDLFVWSARAWTAHVFLEFARLWRVSQVKKVHGAAMGGKGEKMSKKEDDMWWAQLYSNAAWSPLAVSWSLGPERAFASEAMVATLGGFTGWAGLIRAWKAAA